MRPWAVPLALAAVPLLVGLGRTERVYRFAGPGGVPAFSNVYPDTAGPVEARQVSVSALPARVEARFEDGTLYLASRYAGPAQVVVEAASLDNVLARPLLPLELLLPAGKVVPALRVSAADAGRPLRCDVRLRSTPGDPRAVHRPSGPYAPPFPKGRSFPVSQGFHGKVTHSEPGNEYAVDFALPEGTPVSAARAGIVMDVAADFFESGRSLERYGSRANYVRVLHEDGTMAVYAHLQEETVRVRLGTKVSAGQVIAQSGNTGYSSGPHLHFAVERNAGMRLVSVPFSFKDASGRLVEPATGMLLSR